MWRKVFNRETSDHYDRLPLTILTLVGLFLLTLGGFGLYAALVEFGWMEVLINASVVLLFLTVIVGGWYLLYFIVGKVMYLFEEYRRQKAEERQRKYFEDLYKPKTDITKPYTPSQSIPDDSE